MLHSKLTQKYQASIPKKVRDKLHLHKGDTIIFEISTNDQVTVRKMAKKDEKYLSAIEETLNEWSSEEDDRAFKDLQKI